MPRKWTDAQKAKQAQLIRGWKPWRKSTGPKTIEGKAMSSQNVLLGQNRKAVALAEAKQELLAALEKVSNLTGKKRGWWEIF